MRTAGSQSEPRSQTVERAIGVLDVFSADHVEIGLSELARELELNKATTHRLAQTLLNADLLEQDPATRQYRLGLRLLSLAALVQAGLDVRTRARSALDRLREELGETVYLLVLRDLRAVCVERIEGVHFLRDLSTQVGTSLPLNAGAGSKAMLAFLPEDVREQVLAGPLEQRTAATITEPGELRERLAAVREDGWALSAEDVASGAGGIAAPIFDHTGAVVAAVSVGGVVGRLFERRDETAAVVVDAARDISARLGHHAVADDELDTPVHATASRSREQ
jgi:DNA-binding IclR family transcriptional regulator